MPSSFPKSPDAIQEVPSKAQRKRIDALEAELARDAVTQLVNRREFINRLLQAIQSHEPDFGQILVFRQRDLSAINRRMPRHLTDQWLRTTAQRLIEVLDTTPGAGEFMLARLNGSDFALLMPGTASPRAVVWAERIREILLQARLPLDGDGMCRWALGLVPYTLGDNVADLLATLDHTLMRAESREPDRLVIGDTASLEVATGEFAWHDTLMTALQHNGFFLVTHPVQDTHAALVRHDARLKLQTEAGAPAVSPDIFIPAAIRLGLSGQCDIQAVRLGLDWLAHEAGELSVRIAMPSLMQSDFAARLHALVCARNQPARRLILEIDAHAIATLYPKVRALSDLLSECGVRLGVRRLAEQMQAIAHLHTLQLAYLRIGGPFVRGLCHSPGSRELVNSVITTAQRLGVQVHADDVPDAACVELLKTLGVTVMRGPGLKPAATETPAAKATDTSARRGGTDALANLEVVNAVARRGVTDVSARRDAAQAIVRRDAPDASARHEAAQKSARQLDQSQDLALAHRVEDALTNLSVERHLRRESGVMMSHELRTPLSTISAAAQSLEMILAGSGELIDGRIARIRRAAARMTELLDTFFNARHDESGMLAARSAEVDAVALADHVLATMRPDTVHDLQLQSCEPARVYADASLTTVVIRNVLHNAVKYSPPNRPITLAVRARHSDRGPECVFEIADEGVGMSPEELGRIFEHRYRRPAHGEVIGTGIGLSIARKLCEIQNGRLEAASTPGVGTRFTIILPGIQAAKT